MADDPPSISDRISLDIALRYLVDVIDDTVDPVGMPAELRGAVERARAVLGITETERG